MLPKRENLIILSETIDFLVEFYEVTYKSLNFRKLFIETNDDSDSIIVLNQVHQYRRCQIGSEYFGSDMSSQHVNSSFVLALFKNQNRSFNLYFRQVQYFFKHSINLLSHGLVKHKLAYIR